MIEIMAVSVAEMRGNYRKMAKQYDKYLATHILATAKFVKSSIPLTKEDQLIDIGGGTGRISLRIHSDLGMTNPVVCVDPSQDMLDLAQEGGAITVQATAEELFSEKPKYPLKTVLMAGCVHLFKNPGFVFSKLAEYMPEDGVCFVSEYVASSFPFFKAAMRSFRGASESLPEVLKSSGLKYKEVTFSEPKEISKDSWFEAIRNRVSLNLIKFSDKEIEEGIKELVEKTH